MRKKPGLAIACTLVLLLFPTVLSRSYAIEHPETMVAEQVGIFTKLGAIVNLDRSFVDESGAAVTLRKFVATGKPTIIVPVYFSCPRLCGLVLDGVLDLLDKMALELGREYTVLAVSFNPAEGPVDATSMRERIRQRASAKVQDHFAGASFLTGTEDSVRSLMGEIGFKYLPDGKDFAHSAAIMILTPGGVISQYFTGIEFSPWDVRLALIEASGGGIGTAIDHLLLYCFRFDPLQGRYTSTVVGMLRIGGALTLLVLLATVFVFGRWKNAAHAKGA